MKMNVTDTVKQACGHWPRILPALGMKVIKNRHQACPVCGGVLTAFALTIKRARHMVL
jgi:putative DNA primase/helicase